MVPITWALAGKAAKSAGRATMGFLRKIPQSVWVGLVVLLVTLFYGHVQYKEGVKHEAARHAEVQAKLEARIGLLNTALGQATARVETRTVVKLVEIKAQAKIIREKVPYYVSSDSPPLPGGFRLLHDAAVSGTDPAPATAIASAAPVEAQDAATVILDNYEAFHENAARLEGWQIWWAEVEKACKASEACQFQ